MHRTGFGRGLRLALSLRPGAVLCGINFKVLRTYDVLWAEGAGAQTAHRAQAHIHMDIAGLFRRCACEKDLPTRRRALVCAQLARYGTNFSGFHPIRHDKIVDRRIAQYLFHEIVPDRRSST